MTTEADSNESNPYRSPAPCDVVEQPLVVASGTFHWRVIPVCLLYFVGAFLVVGGLWVLGSELWQASYGRGPSKDIGMAIAVVPGCFYLYAGRSLWRGPVLRGVLVTLLAIAAHVAFGVFATCLFGIR
jgi:hypothetical protein